MKYKFDKNNIYRPEPKTGYGKAPKYKKNKKSSNNKQSNNSNRPFQFKLPKTDKQDEKRILLCKYLIKERVESELSYTEKIIHDFLVQNEVEFIREAYSKTLFNPKSNCLLFIDFYLPKFNLAIEYDGKHHRKHPDMDRHAVKQQQYKDRLKDKWCAKNGIKMIRIKKVKGIEKLICKILDEIDPII